MSVNIVVDGKSLKITCANQDDALRLSDFIRSVDLTKRPEIEANSRYFLVARSSVASTEAYIVELSGLSERDINDCLEELYDLNDDVTDFEDFFVAQMVGDVYVRLSPTVSTINWRKKK